ncbi:MFS transporter [Nocardiopsis alba]|uniref:MFS transporter n=1 Tax=Nocardiopsis alba TaxID=53437 RepID=UPI00366E25F2
MTTETRTQRTTEPKEERRFGRAFNRFWAGTMVAGLGDGMLFTALPLLAALFTHDPLLVAGLMVAQSLPWLLFGLPVGVLVDRWDRGRIVTCSNLIRAGTVLVLSVLVATGNADIWTLYVVMFVVMTCDIFFEVATQTMVLGLAPVGGLDRANARLTGGRTLTEDFSGAPLAGLLFAVAAVLPLAVNVGAYVLSALILLALPMAVRRPRDEDVSSDEEGKGEEKGSVLAELKEGMRYVYTDAPLRTVVVISTVMRMALAAQGAVMVLLVLRHFEVPEELYGVFMSTAAIGAVVGVLLVGRVVERLGRFRLVVTAFTAMGVSCLLLALSPNAYLGAAAWALLAMSGTISGTVTVGAAQLIVPERIIGRVMSCVRMISFGLAPVGALLGGLLAGMDLRLPSLVAGTALLLVLLLTVRAVRIMLGRADENEARMWEEEAEETERISPGR